MLIRRGMVALLLAACAVGDAEPKAERIAYTNARVFDGDRFTPGAIVIEGDRIVDADPSTAGRRIDLGAITPT